MIEAGSAAASEGAAKPGGPGITIDDLKAAPHLLPKVVELWGEHRATLGFFPDGAFRERAQQGQILAALDESATLMGFLTFRVSGGRASIIHLCVRTTARGGGVARRLLAEFEQRLDDSVRGIQLRCRRDFDASRIWPRLGFTAVSESRGRSEKLSARRCRSSCLGGSCCT